MHHRSEHGMTLMELLVAMVIGSLVIALVVRGLGLTLNLYDRVANITASMDVRFRESQWWADSVGSLVPCSSVDRCVSGTADTMSGYSFSPILDDGGVRTPVTWSLVSDSGRTVLEYSEGTEEEADVLRMSLDVPYGARFAYLHPDRGWLDEWNSTGDNMRLPAAIRITDQEGSVWMFGTPVQRPYGREDYRDMLGLE